MATRQRAEVDFDRITRRARAFKRQEEYAIGLLASYLTTTRKQSSTRKSRKRLRSTSSFTRSSARPAVELSVEWVELEIDQYLSAFGLSDPDAEVWTEEGGEIVGTNDSVGPAQLDGEEPVRDTVEPGDLVATGSEINLGITAGTRPGRAVKNYDVQSLETAEGEGQGPYRTARA